MLAITHRSPLIAIQAPTPEHLQNALEASCASLVTFQLVCDLEAKPAFDVRRGQERAAQAIESLRQAISELRMAQSEDPSALALGFVASEDTSSRRRER